MAIADRAAAFLSSMGSAVPPSVANAAGNSFQQMKAVARHAGTALAQIGTATGTALAGEPTAAVKSYMVPNVYQNKATGQYVQYKGTKGGQPAAVAAPYMSIPRYNPTVGPAAPGSINTLGGMLNKNFPQVAAPIQRMMATPEGSMMLGAGVVGAGALGLGLTGAALMNRKKERMAGEDLGNQLGVSMPA